MFYLILLMIPILGVVLGVYVAKEFMEAHRMAKTAEAELNTQPTDTCLAMTGLSKQLEADMFTPQPYTSLKVPSLDEVKKIQESELELHRDLRDFLETKGLAKKEIKAKKSKKKIKKKKKTK